jgi:hypothetical protein
MLDYLFFDEEIVQRFTQQARALGCAVVVEKTQEGGVQARVEEASLTDVQREALETLYDELFFGDQAALLEDGTTGADACGVQLTLADGSFSTVLLTPETMNKLLSVLTPLEVQDLFARVADAVENPQSCSVCHAMEAGLIRV